MAALKKAVYSLFGGKVVPAPEVMPVVARKLFLEVVHSLGDDSSTSITKADLYRYLVFKSEAGISMKSVDKLFGKMDTSGDGLISEAEFCKAVSRICDLIREDHAFEAKLSQTRPDQYVVPGSYRMNQLSGTQSFGMKVLKRSDMIKLWELFTDINMDGNGAVSLMEFKRHMAKHKPSLSHMSVSIFNSLDKLGTGQLTFKKLLQRLFPEATPKDIKVLMHMADPTACLPQAKPDLSLLEEVRSIFSVYDDDGSGTLDCEEFVHALDLAGFAGTEAASIFQEIDTDHSGEVSFEEFQIWFVNYARRQPSSLQDAGPREEET